jgi:hypothetical protein
VQFHSSKASLISQSLSIQSQKLLFKTMCFEIHDTFDANLEFLTDNGLVEVEDNDGGAGPKTYHLTDLGKMQGESMAARCPVVNLCTGAVSSPRSGNVSPDTAKR